MCIKNYFGINLSAFTKKHEYSAWIKGTVTSLKCEGKKAG